jgi:type IV pilus biogenesis protein CpaD/CtpE
MNIDLKLPIAISLGLALSGCATTNMLEEPGDSQFGEANRQTMMAQVVNPDPVYTEPMTTSGEHAADAIERYRNDQVTEVESVSTSEGTGSN